MRSSVQDWSPHMNSILKGSQISSLQMNSWFKSKPSIQEYKNEIQISYWTCAWIMWYMFPIQCEELIKHPYDSTSCSDKCHTLVGSCGRQIIWRTSSDVFIINLELRYEGLFWERYILKGQIMFEGHQRLQSWTLMGSQILTPSHLRSIRAISTIESMKVGIYHFTRWGPKYDMDAYMALLAGGEAWDLCCELSQEEARPKLHHKSWVFFCIK
jgi:hypothetical protein